MAQFSQSPDELVQAAHAAWRSGDTAAARAGFERALEIEPRCEEALAGLAALAAASEERTVLPASTPGPSPVAPSNCAMHPTVPTSHFCSGCGRAMCLECEIVSGGTFLCDRCFSMRAAHSPRDVDYSATTRGVVVEDASGRRVVPPEIRVNFGTRFVAAFIDGLILLIPTTILNSIVPFVGGFLVGAMYSIVTIGNGSGQTPGMQALNIRVVSGDGRPLDYGKAAARYVASMLSQVLLFLGYALIAVDPDKQSLHDKICNTYVVGRKDIETWIFLLLLFGTMVLCCGASLLFAMLGVALVPGTRGRF